jgi:hypothetical protein
MAVDARGAIVAASAHVPEIVEFSADGAESWRRSTGAGPSVSGVALLGDGTRVVVTSAAEAIGFAPDGTPRFRTVVEQLERASRVGLLPLEDGGLAFAAGAEVVVLDSDGHLAYRLRLPERIQGPLLTTRLGLLASTQSGTVYRVSSGFASPLAELGGDPGESGASTPDGSRLFAVIDGQRIVVLDLARRSATSAFAAPDHSLIGPIVFGRDDTIVATTIQAALFLLPKIGGAPIRRPLDARAVPLAPDAARPEAPPAEELPPPLPDAQGYVAFVRPGGRAGIVAPDGTLRIVEEPVCASPAALVPAGPRRIAVGCRTGAVVVLGDGTPP